MAAESKGLIRSRRSGGNQRRYARDMLRRIGFIRASQQVGISLNDIRRALEELPDNRTPTEEDWARLGRRGVKISTAVSANCCGCGTISPSAMAAAALSGPLQT